MERLYFNFFLRNQYPSITVVKFQNFYPIIDNFTKQALYKKGFAVQGGYDFFMDSWPTLHAFSPPVDHFAW